MAAKKKTAAKTPTKPAPSARKPKAAANRPVPRRDDYGAPVEAFFAKQPATLAPLVTLLRKLVEESAPDAKAALKWGMPFYTIGDGMVCGLGVHKAHVNLVLSGPPGTFADPRGLLEGDGKTGRRLKLTAADDVPQKDVRGWVKAAAQLARAKAK